MGHLSRNWRQKDSDKMRIKSPLSLVRVFWPHFGAQIGHCVVFFKIDSKPSRRHMSNFLSNK